MLKVILNYLPIHSLGSTYLKLKLPHKAVECYERCLDKLHSRYPDRPSLLEHLACARRMIVDDAFAITMATPNQRVCEECLKVTSIDDMWICTVCYLSYYCGKACQTKAWKEHEKMCKKMPKDPCLICFKGGAGLCSGCKTVRYCCKQHQKSDWECHRTLCKMWAQEKKNKK